MSASQNTLIYLLYGGNADYQLELSYSVLTAIQMHGTGKAPRIVLFTNEKGRRDDLPIEHYIFSKTEFARWTDNGRYRHGAKVGAFLTAIDCFGGKVALLDTDTYFLATPAELFARVDDGAAVMHADEGVLAQKENGWKTILAQAAHEAGPVGSVSPGSRIFNSGVIGAHCSARNLVAEVGPLMDRLHKIAPNVHDVEQFAFTHLLGRELSLWACDDLVRHYWGFERRFIHSRIRDIFPEFSADAFSAALGKRHSVEGFPRKRLWDQLLARLKRSQRRGLHEYQFAYLAYLSAFGSQSRPDANAWAATALDVIENKRFSPMIVKADFRRLTPDLISRVSWIDPETRGRWEHYWSSKEV